MAKRSSIVCVCAWACLSVSTCLGQQIQRQPFQQGRASATSRRSWGPEQATGAPDTNKEGDIATAWAPLEQNKGIEWLHVDFEQPVSVGWIRIRETFNPGAVFKVSVVLPDGRERSVWEGRDPTIKAPGYLSISVTDEISTKSVIIYLDTRRVSGWNEIDAVELIAKDGTRQWASNAYASSTFAEQPSMQSPSPIRAPISDPFSQLVRKHVVVYLEGGMSVSGTFVLASRGFLVLKQPDDKTTVLVNQKRILYIEADDARLDR